jgi:hypothetical protein
MLAFPLFALILAACGAQNIHVAPVKIEPIHVTVDVNLHDTAPGAKPTSPR